MESYYEKYRPSNIDEVVNTAPEIKEQLFAEDCTEEMLYGQYGAGKTLTAEILLRQREEA